MKGRGRGDDEEFDAVSAFLSKDVIFNITIILFVLVAALFLLANPKSEFRNAEVNVPAGSYWIETYFEDRDPQTGKLIAADVDTYVQLRSSPNRPPESPVYFYNLGTTTYNYERDDRGNRPGWDDWDPINYEVVKSRGYPVGETCVNLHLYDNDSSLTEIPVLVTVRRLRGKVGIAGETLTSTLEPLLTAKVKLVRVKQEINVFCFTVDEEGELIKEKTIQSDAVCMKNANGCE